MVTLKLLTTASLGVSRVNWSETLEGKSC